MPPTWSALEIEEAKKSIDSDQEAKIMNNHASQTLRRLPSLITGCTGVTFLYGPMFQCI